MKIPYKAFKSVSDQFKVFAQGRTDYTTEDLLNILDSIEINFDTISQDYLQSVMFQAKQYMEKGQIITDGELKEREMQYIEMSQFDYMHPDTTIEIHCKLKGSCRIRDILIDFKKWVKHNDYGNNPIGNVILYSLTDIYSFCLNDKVEDYILDKEVLQIVAIYQKEDSITLGMLCID